MYNARMTINIILNYTFIIQTNTFNIVNCVAVLKEEVASQIEHIVKVSNLQYAGMLIIFSARVYQLGNDKKSLLV